MYKRLKKWFKQFKRNKIRNYYLKRLDSMPLEYKPQVESKENLIKEKWINLDSKI